LVNSNLYERDKFLEFLEVGYDHSQHSIQEVIDCINDFVLEDWTTQQEVNVYVEFSSEVLCCLKSSQQIEVIFYQFLYHLLLLNKRNVSFPTLAYIIKIFKIEL